jgi:hypothetical protein
MSFKIRDLMISVLQGSAEQKGCNLCTGTTGAQDPGFGCHTCTGTTGRLCYYHGQYPGQIGCPTCTGTTGQAMNGCVTCTGTTHELLQAQAATLAVCTICTGLSPLAANRRPEALAELRQQLQGLLAEVEAEERRIEAESFPQTAEEAEALEAKLEEALAEVRSRKGGLPKKG